MGVMSTLGSLGTWSTGQTSLPAHAAAPGQAQRLEGGPALCLPQQPRQAGFLPGV